MGARLQAVTPIKDNTAITAAIIRIILLFVVVLFFIFLYLMPAGFPPGDTAARAINPLSHYSIIVAHFSLALVWIWLNAVNTSFS